MAKKIMRNDGRYSSKISLGDGKYKYVYAHSQGELDRKVREIRSKMDKGLDVSAGMNTFDEWGKRWLAKKSRRVSENWHKALVINYNKLSPLYKVPVCQIRTIDLEDILDNLAEQRYSQRVIKAVKDIAVGIMDMVCQNRIIDYNPFTHIDMPTANPIKRNNRRALTQTEQQWIIDTPHRAQTAAMIMMYAGLRRGELLALQWSDIDFEKGTINVNKSVVMSNGQPEIKMGGKTENASRIVYIPKVLIDYLKDCKKDNFLVVPSANSKLMSDSAWRRLWDSYITELNFKYGNFSNHIIDGKPCPQPKSKYQPGGVPIVIPRFTAHWLRHTFITLMYFSGIDAYAAAKQAGHSDIKVTLEIYTHLDSEYKQKSVEKLDHYLLQGCQMVVKNGLKAHG